MCGFAASNTGEKTANKLRFNQKLKITISVCFAVFFCTFLLLFPVEDPIIYDSKVAERGIVDGSIPRAWSIRLRKGDSGKRIDVVPSHAPALHGMGVLFRKGTASIRLRKSDSGKKIDVAPSHAPALHGMGVLFRKGTASMNELIVAHLTDRVTGFEVRMFVRTLYRSGALARADLVILFPRNSVRDEGIYNVIEEECDLGFKKVNSYFCSTEYYRNASTAGNSSSISVFNAEVFRRAAEERNRRNKKRPDRPGMIGVGSIMGFEMEELDPDNILESFIDNPPAQLRRWVCYQLLLGYLRRKYTSVLLARIGAVVILTDAMEAIRKSSGLFLLTESRSWDVPAAGEEFVNSPQDRTLAARRPRGRKTSQKPQRRATKAAVNRKKKMALVEAVYGLEIWRSLSMEERQKKMVNSGIIAGKMSSVRALSNAMVNEVIRVTMERKSRSAFPDEVPLSYLIHRTSILDRKVKNNIHIDGLSGHGISWASLAHIIRQDLCSSPDDAALYPDCSQSPEPSR